MFISFGLSNISGVVFTLLSGLLLIALLQEAFLMAYIDELTDIPGRKALEKQMAALGRRYSIAMLDIDHFKKFNDTHGHDVGDQVLRMVAARINKVTGGGKAYRYGGEEFTILFPGKTVEQTLTHLELVRESVESYAMSLRQQTRTKDDKLGKKQRTGTQGKSVRVTISIGVAQRNDIQDEPNLVIKQADKALYAAKHSGRNCIKALKPRPLRQEKRT
jgi:diguanylate cyclase (GGDEF)-like protein